MELLRRSSLAQWRRRLREHPVEPGVHLLIWVGIIVAVAVGKNNGIGWFHQPEQSLWWPMVIGAIWNAVTFLGAGRLAVHALLRRRWVAWLTGLVRLSVLVLIGKTAFQWLYILVAEPELRVIGFFELAAENSYSLTAMLLAGTLYFLVRASLIDRETPPPGITVRSGQTTHRLRIDSIRYLKSESNYVAFHGDGRPLLVLMTMDGAGTLLDDSRFIRIHRSYIVNLDHVTGMNRISVRIGEESLPIGKTYRSAVKGVVGRRLG
jgi:hypothetical protein